MRIPGTKRIGKWAEKTFALTPADKAGIRRAVGDAKVVVTAAAADPVVTGGQLWQAALEHPKAAITAYVIPTITRASAKSRREYRRRDPDDTYGTPTREEPPDA